MKQLLFLIFFLSLASFAQGITHFSNEQVRVELAPIYDVYLQNSTAHLALIFDLKPGWHVYWMNPGDSGAAPKWKWHAEGASFNEVIFPAPQRLVYGDLINFGYNNRVIFPVAIKTAKDVHSMQFSVELEWLACKIECVPGFTTLSLQSPLADKEQNPRKALRDELNSFLAGAPPAEIYSMELVKEPSPESELKKKYSFQLPKISFVAKEIHLFPMDTLYFKTAAPTLMLKSNEILASFSLSGLNASPIDHRILVVAKGETASEVRSFFYSIEDSKTKSNLGIIFIFAFIGGLILNIMPCVFPILSIKLLSFSLGLQDLRLLKLNAWAYSSGVILSFATLGGLLLFLKSAGEKIGWGFQLQSPAIVISLTLLFFVLSLSFLGLWELGQTWGNFGQKLQKQDGLGGAFFTGMLATIVATPCTAPFMGSALGASLILPNYLALLVFVALGAGMASPFLILAYFPQALMLLPKPGPWMLRLKEFLAFPLLITCVWLLWVLAFQVSETQVFKVLIAAVLIALGFWLLRQCATRKMKFICTLLIGLALILSLYKIEAKKPSTQVSANAVWNSYDKSEIKKRIESGQGIFIDFTAAWCITCQVNKKAVLETEEILNLFRNKNIYLVRADWTNQDPVITEALAGFGRNSLPLYVFYSEKSQGVPKLLPEVLTKQMIRDLF